MSLLSVVFQIFVSGEATDAEAKEIIEKHQRELQEALDKFDISKRRQLGDLERKLAEKHAERENKLRAKHEQEALRAGIPAPQPSKSLHRNLASVKGIAPL